MGQGGQALRAALRPRPRRGRGREGGLGAAWPVRPTPKLTRRAARVLRVLTDSEGKLLALEERLRAPAERAAEHKSARLRELQAYHDLRPISAALAVISR